MSRRRNDPGLSARLFLPLSGTDPAYPWNQTHAQGVEPDAGGREIERTLAQGHGKTVQADRQAEHGTGPIRCLRMLEPWQSPDREPQAAEKEEPEQSAEEEEKEEEFHNTQFWVLGFGFWVLSFEF
jgi:hypothetical protein